MGSAILSEQERTLLMHHDTVRQARLGYMNIPVASFSLDAFLQSCKLETLYRIDEA